MDDDGSIAKEAGGSWSGGGEEVEVGGLVATDTRNHAVFAREVADLAGLRSGGIAGRYFAADVGVEMSEGGGAVSVGWDGLVVEVVH